MLKVDVLSVTWRPGYIDTMVQALQEQTMPKDQWRWLLVDDLYEQRRDVVKEYIGDSFSFKHIAPREIKPYSATATAMNTGFAHSQGELVYFMVDYMHPHPRCLERHWEIYSTYGPNVLITGPLVDGITVSGRSVWAGAPATRMTVRVGEKSVSYFEHSPPVPLPLKGEIEHPNRDNLLSILKEPFRPMWPESLPLDWRLGHIMSSSVARNLYENRAGPQWWYGKNDSAPLELLRAVGGMPEEEEWRHGGLETQMVERMMALGCRHLVDREAPCYVLPHPIRKREEP